MSDATAEEHPTPLEPQTRPVHLGMFARRDAPEGGSAGLTIGAGVSVIWVLATLSLFLVVAQSTDGPQALVLTAVGALLGIVPVALGWILYLLAGRLSELAAEAERLESAVNAMRQALVQKNQSGILDSGSNVERKLNEIAAAQRRTDEALARFTSVRPDLERAAQEHRTALAKPDQPDTADKGQPGEQATLALEPGATENRAPLSVVDFIKAMNFPMDSDDKDGFNALRRALNDHGASQLIRSAQDVLTLLSQDGIYMDDLHPDRARPEIWRRFARGERGKSVAILGGIRDRSSLALSAGRMRADPIFRDSVHHFLRKFDHVFAEFEKTANDLEIAALTDTRTARAFMLLGRVTGTFD